MTEPNADQDPLEVGQTKEQISLTPPKTGRPARDSVEPPRWTIRGIEADTRLTIEKAAERSGKTLGQFFNSELREAAANVLKKGNQPPAKTEDVVVDLVEKLKAELKESQAAELRSIREAIEQRPVSFRQWLFGKK